MGQLLLDLADSNTNSILYKPNYKSENIGQSQHLHLNFKDTYIYII